MAFKVFAPGVLTSSDVNTFLMRQAVITCTSSTRPASPSEGMTIYETDTDAYAVYDGSNWVYQGLFITYTPALTGLTLGNGSVAFESARVGSVVFVRGIITFGSTTTITAVSPATIEFSLPSTAAGGNPTAAASISLGEAVDDSLAARVPVRIACQSNTTATIGWFEVQGVVVYSNSISTTTTPFTFATDDTIRFTFMYEAA